MTSIPTELRELLERIVAGDVGRMIYAKLATGQATETDDGKAWLELRALLATPPADAADMGGQAGEEVEVMAYAVDHPEAGYKVYKQFSQWMNGGEWRCDSLMTVAQHQRIVAALSAQQSAHVSVPRDIAMALLDDGPRAETWKAQAALRALLNGGEA